MGANASVPADFNSPSSSSGGGGAAGATTTTTVPISSFHKSSIHNVHEQEQNEQQEYSSSASPSSSGIAPPPPSYNAAVSSSSTSRMNDPSAQALSRDFPHHVIESKLPSGGGGRMVRSYRLQSADGVSLVVKCGWVRIVTGGGGGGGGGGNDGGGGDDDEMVARLDRKVGSGQSSFVMTREELQARSEQLRHIRDGDRQQQQQQQQENGNDISNSSTSKQQQQQQQQQVWDHPNVLPYVAWMTSPNANLTHTIAAATSNNASNANSENANNNNNNNNNNTIAPSVPVYLIRQHVHHTLRERLVTRPFLTLVEKCWMTHLLLNALHHLHHHHKLCHGHLTPDNVGVTSWGWIVLLDVGNGMMRPTYLPDDDPRDYLHYFAGAAGGRKHFLEGATAAPMTTGGCYVAPERFYTPTPTTAQHTTGQRRRRQQQAGLTPAMDIFSAGCVLMELFLNGELAFELADLMEYRREGKLIPSLQQKLNKIESSSIRAAIKHMLHLNPTDRWTSMEYLQRLSSPLQKNDDHNTKKYLVPIPKCFDTLLYPLLEQMKSKVLSPDARIQVVAAHYGEILQGTIGINDIAGQRYFHRMVGRTALDLASKEIVFPTTEEDDHAKTDDQNNNTKTTNSQQKRKGKQSSKSSLTTSSFFPFCNESNTSLSDGLPTADLLAETEELLQRLELCLSNKRIMEPSSPSKDVETEEGTIDSTTGAENIPFRDDPDSSSSPPSPSESSLIIILQLILSSIRHVQRPSTRIIGMRLMLRLGNFTTDEIRLQRIVPTLVSLLYDPDAFVRANVVIILTAVLSMIRSFPPSDAHIFPEYIFKRLAHLASDPAPVVCVAFAESIAKLAETSRRFLDISQANRLYETVAGGGEGGVIATSSNMVDASANKTTTTTIATPVSSSVVSDFPDNVAKLLGETKKKTKSSDQNPQQPRVKGDSPSRWSSSPTMSNTTADANTPGDRNNAVATTLLKDTYDTELASLHAAVSRWVVHIATDDLHSSSASSSSSSSSSSPKRALLRDLARLCNFFGREGVVTFILPQILSFLNDRRDWRLRASLCDSLPPVCAMVGRAATEHFVVPCMETVLVDREEQVVARGLHCLTSLVEMGLLARAQLLRLGGGGDNNNSGREGMIEKYAAPLLVYPSADIRFGAASFLAASCRTLGFPDDEALILPRIRSFLRLEPTREKLTTIEGILSCLQPPLTRNQLQWALMKFDKKNFSKTQRNGDALETAAYIGTQSLAGSWRNDNGKHNILENMEGYLRLLYNSRARAPIASSSSDGEELLDSRIENYSKLVYSCYVPNQKYSELMKHPLPDWYDTVQQVARNRGGGDSKDDILCMSETSALQYIYDLSQVYGLIFTQPTNSIETRTSWKGDASSSLLESQNVRIGYDGGVSEENAIEMLSRKEARIFDGSLNGEWGSITAIDSAVAENSTHITKLRCLGVPPLPPEVGTLKDGEGKPYSCYAPVTSSSDKISGSKAASSSSSSSSSTKEWRPKVDALVASSSRVSEHTGPVTRLAVSQDQAFFVSASHDGTSRVWELGKIENNVGDLKSCLAYAGHSTVGGGDPRINDVTILENSHSVATAASNGSVHVWRIDMATSTRGRIETSKYSPRPKAFEASVSGSTVIRKLDPQEGEVLAVTHFNTSFSSIVAFATQRGVVHTWDLRCATEPFALRSRPEFGYLTSMVIGTDRNWMVTGTNKGYLSLWDIRFQKLVKLSQHSTGAPVKRLATAFASLSNEPIDEPKPLAFVGCGLNEASVFDVTNGRCKQCFRALDPSLCFVETESLPLSCRTLPKLNDVPIPSSWHRRGMFRSNEAVARAFTDRITPPEPTIQALMGRLGPGKDQNYLITGGTDCYIRYWDFNSPSRCFAISGMTSSQPRPTFDCIDAEDGGGPSRLFLCRQMPVPNAGELDSHKVPKKLQRGPTRPEHYHNDAVMDLKRIDSPMKGLLSCSRDGVIKLWR